MLNENLGKECFIKIEIEQAQGQTRECFIQWQFVFIKTMTLYLKMFLLISTWWYVFTVSKRR